MRQLARTLLILGGVGACERAHPVVDSQERPAVGNLGQAGRPAVARPAAAAIATPLVDAMGTPAVGNIGQTGAPPRDVKPARRVQRAQRAATTRVAIRPTLVEPKLTVEHPLVSREDRPMTGNVMKKGGARPAELYTPSPSRLAFQEGAESGVQVAAQSPLLDRRERPAHANMGRTARMSPRREYLSDLAMSIEQLRVSVRDATTDEARVIKQRELDALVRQYRQLAHDQQHGGDDE